MNPYAGSVRALGRTRAFAWLFSRVLPPIDARFARRRRSLTSLGTDFPLCYLTTTGRRTGEARTVPLLYVADGERVVLIASNWGQPNHPAWALNLDANHDGVACEELAGSTSSTNGDLASTGFDAWKLVALGIGGLGLAGALARRARRLSYGTPE